MRIQQAGLSWSKQKFLVISLAMGLFGALAGLLGGLPPYAIGIFALTCTLAAPRWLVNFLRKRRLKKFAAEFPNAIDVIVRGVKAGLPLGDCLRIIAREAKEPVRAEFKSINEAQGLGLGTSDAVKRLAENIPLPETKFFVIVITIQQQAGGNLAEALGNLSRVLRERKKMKDKINAMSGEAKASAGIIGILPFIVMVLVYFASPGYINLLFTEPLGNVILGFSGVWMVLGILSMKKMINFDY